MRSLQAAAVLMVFVMADPVHSTPPMVTYQDFLDAAFPPGRVYTVPDDDTLETLRRIVLDVLYTYSQISPNDPDRLCIPRHINNPGDLPADAWWQLFDYTIHRWNKAGHPPEPTARFRDIIHAMLKERGFGCPPPAPEGAGTPGPHIRSRILPR